MFKCIFKIFERSNALKENIQIFKKYFFDNRTGNMTIEMIRSIDYREEFDPRCNCCVPTWTFAVVSEILDK